MWSRKIINLLLVQYRERENLYNVRHPDYQDRIKREKSIFEIYECVKDLDANVSPHSVKAKLHCLRKQFLKEERKIAESKRNRIGQEDVYVPKIWYYDQLKFLKNHIYSRWTTAKGIDKETNNLSENKIDLYNDCSIPGPYSSSISIETETSDSSTSDPLSPQPYAPDSCTPPLSTLVKKRQLKLSKQIDDVKKLISKRLEEKHDYEWLSAQVDFDFKSMYDEEIRRETAWKIQNILREAVLADVNKRKCTLQPS